MRLSAVIAFAVLTGLLGFSGCSGARSETTHFSVPGFGAQEQWEPEIERGAVEAPPES
jgi:hypothetical protein